MNFEQLSIVLLEDLEFEELVPKVEKALNLELPFENHEGRKIGKSTRGIFEFRLVDRYDDLGEFLCDENHTLELLVKYKRKFDFKRVEKELLDQLKDGDIAWKRGVWSGWNIFKEAKFLYPE